MKPSVVYFGTPELAVPPLRALVESGNFHVLGVVTQTDKPAGRGNKLTPPPVKIYAEAAGLPVFQPKSLRSFVLENGVLSGGDPDLAAFLNASAPIDVFVIVAYGKIIPPALIEFPRAGIVNIHMSLLPHLRGASPIQRAVLLGDERSGVSIMRIDEGLDTGPVFAVAQVDVDPSDTTGTLSEKLVAAGSQLLLDTLPKIVSGEMEPRPQDNAAATYAEKLTKDDFRIRWDRPARQVLCVVRAAAPHPGAFSLLGSDSVKVYRASEARDEGFTPAAPGTVVGSGTDRIIVAAGEGFVSLEELQLPGKKRLPVAEFLRGRKVPVGARFE